LLDSGDALLIHLIHMATTKKRINISVSKELDDVLVRLAKRDQVPQATKAEHLLRMALEIEEDEVLDTVATKRDTGEARFLPHSLAWR